MTNMNGLLLILNFQDGIDFEKSEINKSLKKNLYISHDFNRTRREKLSDQNT